MKNVFKTKKSFIFTLIIAVLSIMLIDVKTPNNFAYAQTINTYHQYAKNELNQPTQNLYDYLVPSIKEIASGERSETYFTIESSSLISWGLKLTYTNTELGKETITMNDVSPLFLDQFEINKLLTALLHDLPYEMYWFDKTTGISEITNASGTKTNITITSLLIKFHVSADYKATFYSSDTPKVNLTKTASVSQILNNARQIVETNSELTDYEKLLTYKNKICELNTYNDFAASNSYTGGYGNPWQAVYVFDNNSSTNVVCEGYAKAFQLLCNMSTFNNPNIRCFTVTGTMSGGTGAGNHMWNIITMDDGKNYLVDVTNSDAGTVGASGGLFLKGYDAGSISSGYSFNLSSNISFTYNTQTTNLWGTDADSVLNISSVDYDVNHPVIKVEKTEKIYNKTPITAGLDDTDKFLNFGFDGSIYNENNYNWTYEWYSSIQNNVGTLLPSAPINAGTYFLKIKAINKSNSEISYVHNEMFEIKKKEITVDSVYASGREYTGTKNIIVTVINLSGVISGDNVSVDGNSTTAEIGNANTGTYTSVKLSNIVLSGDHKNNYKIADTIDNILSNNIVITKTNPTCSEILDKITQDGLTLNGIEIEFVAKGKLNEPIDGTYVWTDKNGNPIDLTTEIIKDQTYYYKFTPNNENYNEIIVETKLYKSETAEEVAKRFFTLENLPNLIVYALYIIAGITIITCSIVAINKKRKSR